MDSIFCIHTIKKKFLRFKVGVYASIDASVGYSRSLLYIENTNSPGVTTYHGQPLTIFLQCVRVRHCISMRFVCLENEFANIQAFVVFLYLTIRFKNVKSIPLFRLASVWKEHQAANIHQKMWVYICSENLLILARLQLQQQEYMSKITGYSIPISANLCRSMLCESVLLFFYACVFQCFTAYIKLWDCRFHYHIPVYTSPFHADFSAAS